MTQFTFWSGRCVKCKKILHFEKPVAENIFFTLRSDCCNELLLDIPISHSAKCGLLPEAIRIIKNLLAGGIYLEGGGISKVGEVAKAEPIYKAVREAKKLITKYEEE